MAGRDFDYPVNLGGSWVRQQLARVRMDALALHEALRDNDSIPAWVMSKITTAEDRLHSAADYMRYRVKPALDAFYAGADEGRNLDYAKPMHGRMARQKLARMALDAQKMFGALKDDDRLPPWVPYLVTVAEDRLHAASDYIRYKVAPRPDSFYGAPDAGSSGTWKWVLGGALAGTVAVPVVFPELLSAVSPDKALGAAALLGAGAAYAIKSSSSDTSSQYAGHSAPRLLNVAGALIGAVAGYAYASEGEKMQSTAAGAVAGTIGGYVIDKVVG